MEDINIERQKIYIVDNFHILSKEKKIELLTPIVRTIGEDKLIIQQNKQIAIDLDIIPKHLLLNLYSCIEKERNKLSII